MPSPKGIDGPPITMDSQYCNCSLASVHDHANCLNAHALRMASNAQICVSCRHAQIKLRKRSCLNQKMEVLTTMTVKVMRTISERTVGL